MKKIVILLIKGYRLFFSPLFGMHCRFYPTCSVYGESAIQEYGVILGCWITLKRILRCHPFCPGGYDPLPKCDSKQKKKTTLRLDKNPK